MYKLKIEKITENFITDIDNSWNFIISSYNEEYKNNKELIRKQELLEEKENSKENLFIKLKDFFLNIFNFIKNKLLKFINDTIDFIKEKIKNVKTNISNSKKKVDSMDNNKKKNSKNIFSKIISKLYGNDSKEIDKIIDNINNNIKEDYSILTEEADKDINKIISILKVQKNIFNGLHYNELNNSYLVKDIGNYEIVNKELSSIIKYLASFNFENIKDNTSLSMFNDDKLKENINKLTTYHKIEDRNDNKVFINNFFNNIMNGIIAKEIQLYYNEVNNYLLIIKNNSIIINTNVDKMIKLLDKFKNNYKDQNDSLKMIEKSKNVFTSLSNYNSKSSSYLTHVIADLNIYTNSYNNIVKTITS